MTNGQITSCTYSIHETCEEHLKTIGNKKVKNKK